MVNVLGPKNRFQGHIYKTTYQKSSVLSPVQKRLMLKKRFKVYEIHVIAIHAMHYLSPVGSSNERMMAYFKLMMMKCSLMMVKC